MAGAASPLHLSVSLLLDLYQKTSGAVAPHPADRLRAILRRYPYWQLGHLELARVSLAVGDIPTTYASAQAARLLAKPGSPRMARALHLLGQCFLARGDHPSAVALFEGGREILPNDPPLKEDLAAALMLAGDSGEAVKLLTSIPPSRLSAQGRAALDFLQNP